MERSYKMKTNHEKKQITANCERRYCLSWKELVFFAETIWTITTMFDKTWEPGDFELVEKRGSL